MKYDLFDIMEFDLPSDGCNFMIFESVKSAPAKVIHVFDLSNSNSNNR
jgi:hypothetical protein